MIFTALLAACASPQIDTHQLPEPKLVLEDYFTGDLKAWGVFQDRFGNVRRQFTVDMTGTWDEETQTLTLVEDFLYNDGVTEQRTWEIKKTGENTYEGTEKNSIGLAKGQTTGNAFHWVYDYKLSVDGKIWKVNFDDWMFLQDDQTLFNKAVIRRWGFRLGDVYIFFRKEN